MTWYVFTGLKRLDRSQQLDWSTARNIAVSLRYHPTTLRELPLHKPHITTDPNRPYPNHHQLKGEPSMTGLWYVFSGGAADKFAVGRFDSARKIARDPAVAGNARRRLPLHKPHITTDPNRPYPDHHQLMLNANESAASYYGRQK
jgi:hypothetical protein